MATNWRLAKSLETLRNQVNTAYPNRSKASDGTIGDASHAASASDHNPNKNNVVTAIDITHDPKNGFDAHAFAEHIRKNRHPNLRYVISNARIAGWWTNWEWQSSSGHTQHVHVSVGTLGVGDGQTYDRYDDTTKWSLLKEDSKVEIFNEAARVDINVILFGYDKGWFKGFLGGEYKTAIYAIKESPEFRAEQFVNKGDLQNYLGRIPTVAECNEFKIKLGKGIDRALPGSGVTHKDCIYNLIKTGRFVGGEKPDPAKYEEVKETLYRKK